jgi:hypothetical protein
LRGIFFSVFGVLAGFEAKFADCLDIASQTLARWWVVPLRFAAFVFMDSLYSIAKSVWFRKKLSSCQIRQYIV